MLIYVNQLHIRGDDALLNTMKTISGWLKQITGKKINVSDLYKPNEFVIGKQRIRTYNAIHADPHMYSILFSNPDATIHGRQWITELGIRVENDGVFFTVMLETSDISTQVTEVPQSSRPKVIKYLQENCDLSKNTIGLKVLKYGSDMDSFRGLLAEIERKERSFPLVVVSSDENNRPLFNLDNLQEQLVGLAQVVTNKEEIDTWEMERIVGRRYAVWGGGVNIIYPIGHRMLCPRNLLLREKLLDWKDDGKYLIGEILSLVTHTTNGHRKKNHFSPYDVRAKRQKDHRVYLLNKFEELRDTGDFEELLHEAFEQIDEHESTIDGIKNENKAQIDLLELEKMELEDQIESMEDDNKRLVHTVDELKYRINSKAGGKVSEIDPEYIQLIVEGLSLDLSPEETLKIVEYFYPDRLVVLQSAFDSARESSSFKHTRKLIGLLSKLCNQYIEALRSGGDSKAKTVFGSSYSANESETVERSPKLSKLREFEYKGNQVPMFKHLRIGVADSVEETIRVYFHWDNDEGRIVVGYCGKHLPIGSKGH